jgi:BASS family bile acid:Na+ symporter
MPLLLTLFKNELEEPATLDVPLPLVIAQLLLLLILPILVGMFVRRTRPGLAERHGRTLLRLGIIALAALLILIIVEEWERLLDDFAEISLAVAALTAIMMAAGFLGGRACAVGAGDRFSLAMVLVVRNVGIATAVAVTVLGRTEFAVFATAYFLNQMPIIVLALLFFRLTRSPGPATPR